MVKVTFFYPNLKKLISTPYKGFLRIFNVKY